MQEAMGLPDAKVTNIRRTRLGGTRTATTGEYLRAAAISLAQPATVANE